MNGSESPYVHVGLARIQDGGSNECISNYTILTQLGMSVMHFEMLSVLSSAALANEMANIAHQQCQGSKAATSQNTSLFSFSSFKNYILYIYNV